MTDPEDETPTTSETVAEEADFLAGIQACSLNPDDDQCTACQ